MIADDKISKLLPLLYQAKFHPSSSVKATMTVLWSNLISDKESYLISTFQEAILVSLMSSLSSVSWKDREASASALELFLPQRKWTMLVSKLQELWELGIRLLDDIQPSTVLAAVKLMKVLLDQVLRACNPTESDAETKTIQNTIALILPVILDKGLSNSTAEVRGFSLGALMKIIKTIQSSLGKWTVPIVSVLTESMSALEPRSLQYMEFHTSRLQISEEELESFRLRLCQESPMQEALDECLQSLTGDMIPEITYNLCSFLHSGIGVATRVSAAKSIAFLAEKYPSELGSHSVLAFKNLIHFLLNSSQNRLDSLRKSILSTLSALGKIIPPQILEDSILCNIIFLILF